MCTAPLKNKRMILIGSDLALQYHAVECTPENKTNNRQTSESDKESEHVALFVSSKLIIWPLPKIS